MLTTFGSILTAGSVWDTTFLVYCMDNSQSLPETVTTLDSWVAWSLLELSLGHFLDRDPYNRQHPNHAAGRCGPIAGPYKAVLAVHKGDEKYIQKVYKMTHSANSKFVCFTCKAQADGPHVYSTYGPSAPHRSTVMSTSEFISCASGAQSWTRLPGWSVSNLCNDWLHVVDLTVTPECCASVSWPKRTCEHVLNTMCFCPSLSVLERRCPRHYMSCLRVIWSGKRRIKTNVCDSHFAILWLCASSTKSATKPKSKRVNHVTHTSLKACQRIQMSSS